MGVVGVHEGLQKKSLVQVRLEGFASDHGLPQEQFYNLLCLAYGPDPVLFEDLTRSAICPRQEAHAANVNTKNWPMRSIRKLARISIKNGKEGVTDELAPGACAARASEVMWAEGR